MFSLKSQGLLGLGLCLSLLMPLMAQAKDDQKPLSATDIVEATIYVYGGREALANVRTNGIERANVVIPTTNGNREGQLTTRFIRKDKSWLDYKRIDLVMPEQTLSLGYNGEKLWANLNGVGIQPRPEAERTFRASLIHNYTALLRYREDNAKLEYKGIQKVIGLDCHVIEMTHENGEKTTFYISTRTYRVLHLDYELALTEGAAPTKYRISYFDFKQSQGTLVPMRTIVRENDQVSQEIHTTGVTYRIALEDDVFEHY